MAELVYSRRVGFSEVFTVTGDHNISHLVYYRVSRRGVMGRPIRVDCPPCEFAIRINRLENNDYYVTIVNTQGQVDSFWRIPRGTTFTVRIRTKRKTK
ncbi:hypothetical protein SAMN05444955_102284 [Lihuaxuella thermophila]|uniref:Uncharacterized protein n=1 Tax=Lihuaxuella thermophila TaxID=1173111 RepID=A0A1H8BR46_9BACL|nr:hypothetical protein SAMN05444955_102284 [Lihuaxuella thermophila]